MILKKARACPSRDKRGVSPVISTVILTGALIALLSVTLVFANNFLWASLADNDYSTAKGFMKTIGLQMDDVAWTVGRTETIQYSSRYGEVTMLPSALNYTFYVKTTGEPTYQLLVSHEVGVLLFNIPVSKISLGNSYYELLYPSQDINLTLTGASAPIFREFVVEKLPMADGSFLRVVIAPSIRSLFSTMDMPDSSTYFIKTYLPKPIAGATRGSAQTVTMKGSAIGAIRASNVTSVKITVGFPRGNPPENFDATFFNFPSSEQIIDVPGGYDESIFELYVGEVAVDFGTGFTS